VTRPAEVLQLCSTDTAPFQSLCNAHARALQALGARVTTVFMEPSAEPEGRNAEAHYLNLPAGYAKAAALKALREQLGDQAWDLVLCHRYKMMQLALRLQPRHAQQRIIALAHEFGYFRRRKRVWYQRLFAPGVRFAAVSQPVADDMRTHHPALRGPLVLPNALDVRSLQAVQLPRVQAREALGLDPDHYLIGNVGRLHHKKQPELALQAFAALANELPPGSRLVMMGDGQLQPALQQVANELGIEAQVDWLGKIPGAARYMAAFDQFWFTTGHAEAFGVTLLEAMAAGQLVVSADGAGPRTVLGDAGLYYRTGDVESLTATVREALQLGPEAADRLRCGARERARLSFSTEALVAAYATILPV
jgi:glycosyltransferase involved in cell wall biosynthesis